MTSNVGKWVKRFLLALGGAVGLFLLVAVVMKVPFVESKVNDPAMCATCHVMEQQVASHAASSHRTVSCNACHLEHGFLSGPFSEMKVGSRHLAIFVTGATPATIRARSDSRAMLQKNCISCHATTLHETELETGGRYCWECHRSTPHEKPYVRQQ